MSPNRLLLSLPFFLLAACSLSTNPQNADDTQRLFYRAPPITATRLAGDATCGNEVHHLFDEQGQIKGVAKITHSPNYLFVDILPTSPWLAMSAAAEAWENPPALIDPTSFTAFRSSDMGVDSGSLWLPMPTIRADGTIRVAVFSTVKDGAGGRHFMALTENGNPYVSFSVCSEAPVNDPDVAKLIRSLNSEENATVQDNSHRELKGLANL